MVGFGVRKNNLSKRISYALGNASLGIIACCVSTTAIGNNLPNGISNTESDGVTLRIPASNTQVTLSGYVKGDLIFDDSSDLGDTFGFSGIPLDDSAADNEDGHVRFHARQSRVRVNSESDLGGRTLKTQFEGDFFGAGGNESFSNSSTLRIRHANVTIGGFTVGQGWSNFMDFVAYPSTLDFSGPISKSFARQGMIKYTHSSGFSVSLENPETGGDGALGRLRESTNGAGIDQLPDITAAWRGGPGGSGGSYEFAGILRSLGVEGVITNTADTDEDDVAVDETELGWGINLAGGWDFGQTSVSAGVTFGDGIGRYILAGGGNGLFVNADGSVDTVESLGASFSVKQNWTSNTSSVVALGYFSNDDPERSNGIDDVLSLHANYTWAPFDGTTLGGEVIYGDITRLNGADVPELEDGSAVRVQFSAQQNF